MSKGLDSEQKRVWHFVYWGHVSCEGLSVANILLPLSVWKVLEAVSDLTRSFRSVSFQQWFFLVQSSSLPKNRTEQELSVSDLKV